VAGVPTTLTEHLVAAVGGRFPPADGGIEVVPPDPWGVDAVVCFTGHTVVASRLTSGLLRAAGADGLGGATLPPVLTALAGPTGEVDCLDALLAARGTGEANLSELPRAAAHPRVAHARRWREDVRAFGDDRGIVVIARGVGGLLQVSYEVPLDRRGHGLGRSLVREALGLVPAGEPVLVGVAPGNAASLRAALAAGCVPIGSVQLVRPGRPD
jgi:hypothetical protein